MIRLTIISNAVALFDITESRDPSSFVQPTKHFRAHQNQSDTSK